MDKNVIEIYEENEPEYKTVINKKLLPVFCVFWFACIAAAITVGYTVDNAIARDVVIGALIIICVTSILVLFLIIMPKLRVKQARQDINNYDFTEYVASDEESFQCEIAVQKSYFNTFAFVDGKHKTTFKGSYQVEKFLYDLNAENGVKQVLYLDPYDDFVRFYTYGLNEPNFAAYYETEDNTTVVTIVERHGVTFTDKGLKIGGVLFGYKRIIAKAEAMFSFHTYARIILDCGNGIGASFAISPKIIAVLDKFGVTVNDRCIADFILADPALAFDKIAKLSSTKRIKKCANKIENAKK